MSLVLQGPIALLPLLLNRPMRGQSVIRVLIFVPYVLAEVVVGTGWSLMLQTTVRSTGCSRRSASARSPRTGSRTPAGDLDLCWGSSPGSTSASRHPLPRRPPGHPQELTEAAQIDGASYWQIQRRITLPLLGPTLRIWAFLSIIGSLQLFDLVYIIWGQYIASTAGTSTMATYMVANGAMPATTATATPSRSCCSSSRSSSPSSTSATCCAVTRRAPSPNGARDDRLDHRHPAGQASAGQRPAAVGSPAIYFGAFVVIALMLAPILYIIVGGFRTNAQITADPSGCPRPG